MNQQKMVLLVKKTQDLKGIIRKAFERFSSARLAVAWKIHFDYIHNQDVSKVPGGTRGALVRVADLNDRNRHEVERMGYEEVAMQYEVLAGILELPCDVERLANGNTLRCWKWILLAIWCGCFATGVINGL